MRILVVTQYYWPETFRINDLVTDLVQRGHEITVLTGIPNYPEGTVYTEFTIDPSKFSEHEGARVVRVPMFARGKGNVRLVLNYLSYALSASLIGFCKLRKQQFDVIFCYQLSPITIGVPAILFRLLRGIPLVFWVLDLWPDTLEAVGVVRSKRTLSAIGKLVSFIYNNCDLILGQSKSFLPHIIEMSKNSRVEYFPSWADALFQQMRIKPISSMVSVEQFNIMFAGNVGEAQDFPAVLQAVELLKNNTVIHWTIVGDGRMSDWLENEIVQRGLQSSIKLAGRHPIEKMPEFFHQADALLVSLKNEPIFAMTIPGKLQAYLMSGKPILAMLNGEGANIVAESGCGITCSSGNWKCLAAAAQRLSTMPESELDAMGKKGINLSMKEFNREELISQLEIWMMELANSDGKNSSGVAHYDK
jgi:colanic acid biosynthesis glycosyl transferase WcaI